ncbi:MAG: aminotransferase class III-fold pyridoxal phosphate-dependent enzyme, partial [Clostridia bacterium]|nr:aminotransferase class III-fold pyridoxal phosphate-dependent enzyme [Clostridia bacterium]
EGREYIDTGSGIAVNGLGVADDLWLEAVTEQLRQLPHTSNLYYTRPDTALARMLCERTGLKKVFFGNSGAEANECAIKVARKYSAEKKGAGCYTIVTLKNSFHGRTLATLSATGQDHYHELYQPLVPGFEHIEPGDMGALEAIDEKTPVAGIMIECVQGEGGVVPLEAGFVHALADFAHARDIPLMVDEVQTGNGRSGALYAYMTYGIRPDIVSTAKGLGGGLPIGACLMGEQVQDVLTPGDHGSTFGGNPAVCAGAVSILSRIDEALLEGVRRRSAYIFEQLCGAEGIESVTGLGLMIGIKPVKPARQVVETCIDNGVLCLTAKDRVRLLPALNIPMELLEKAVAVLKEACK